MKSMFAAFLMFLACGPAMVGATTWHVEQDGSGDWTTIQAAVEASTDGDTIRIGPGRYSVLHEAPYSLVVAYWDEPKELFFIGAGMDSTIVGPEAYTGSPIFQFGFNYVGTSSQHIQNIAFTNLDHGVYLTGTSSWMSRCKTEECKFGISILNAIDGAVVDSEFSMYGPESPWGGVQLRGSRNVVVEDCVFHNMDVYLHGSEADTIRNCSFRGDWKGSDGVFYYSSGVFEFNEIDGGGGATAGSGTIEVIDNVFYSNPIDCYSIYISDQYSDLQIYRNVFYGAYGTTIYLLGNASIVGSENHIFHEPGTYAVKLRSYSGTYPSTVDLRNNYWGTTDPDSIAAWIWDGNDDPTIEQTVQIEPFSTVPLPTEEQSLDSFKSMFR